jgi:5'-phosphate synthase pdxT subunit
MRIGVLALQGDFAEHKAVLQRLAVEVTEVRQPADLQGLEGLIIPGGESTTIGKLATRFELMEPLRTFGAERAIWGTCAGAIFLARDVQRDQPLLGLMDITVERNAFGRQVDSFEANLTVDALSDPARPFHAVFIRAPVITRIGAQVEVLASLPPVSPGASARIVAARQGRLLATAFHPELAGDDRFHQYFCQQVTR